MTNVKAMELSEREMENVNGGYGYGFVNPFSEAWKKVKEYLNNGFKQERKYDPFRQDDRPDFMKDLH